MGHGTATMAVSVRPVCVPRHGCVRTVVCVFVRSIDGVYRLEQSDGFNKSEAETMSLGRIARPSDAVCVY